MYNMSDIDCIKYLTEIRLKFNALNEHKFRHNVDCLSPCCTCGEAVEDNEHSPPLPLIRNAGRDLLGQLSDIPGIEIMLIDSKS